MTALLLMRSGAIPFDAGILASGSAAFFVNYAFSLNLFILVMSLLPVHYFFGEIRGMETDGLKIIRAIRSKEKP